MSSGLPWRRPLAIMLAGGAVFAWAALTRAAPRAGETWRLTLDVIVPSLDRMGADLSTAFQNLGTVSNVQIERGPVFTGAGFEARVTADVRYFQDAESPLKNGPLVSSGPNRLVLVKSARL